VKNVGQCVACLYILRCPDFYKSRSKSRDNSIILKTFLCHGDLFFNNLCLASALPEEVHLQVFLDPVQTPALGRVVPFL